MKTVPPLRELFWKKYLFVCALGITLGCPSVFGEQSIPSEEYPAIALRGYGEVTGKLWKFEASSVLEITCEDEEKAKLTQAKYLSDLTTLPGVTPTDVKMGDKKLSAWKAKEQGVFAAVRSGNSVFIGAGKLESDLLTAISVKPGGSIDPKNSVAAADVPMWLNRWDKHGFRFYYRAWDLPQGANKFADYDFSQEFEWAEKMDHSGMMFWALMEDQDTAEGITNEHYWNWAMRSAAARNLPVGLNISNGAVSRLWFFNRFRDQTMQKMPQFTGNFHAIANPFFGGGGALSWNSTTGHDLELGILQGIVSRAVQYPNVTSILEPHGEVRHGAQDIFMEYGPVADATFRKFLEERYQTVEALNLAWATKFANWNEVTVPEVASFIGWGPQAIDLTGQWRVGNEKTPQKVERDEQGGRSFESVPSEGAPEEWFSEKFNDSDWPVVTAPGHDRTSFLPNRPAVYRQTFKVPASWLAKNPRIWLYVWDLNTAQEDKVRVVLNGKTVGESQLERALPHWGAYEITNVLRAGNNQLSLRLPKGILAYRVYLSSSEPKQYPNLGKAGNARWVDFAEWIAWSRLEALRRGMEMIRQVEPNRQIAVMAPDGNEDGIKKLAVAYGANFHNTGYMGAFWADSNPSIMRGARLPFSVETASPAGNLKDFKKCIGLYATEGIQGLDYFISLGSVYWNADIKKFFEDNLRLIHLLGKYHAPPADVAALYSTRQDTLTGYPWGADANTNLGFGYWDWNVRAYLMGRYESDGLTESSFDDGNAARYRVVIDTNTSIMDDTLVSAIEKYVTEGGTFVTFVQTGRHTSLEKDTWPISKLTGYRVAKIDSHDKDGNPSLTHGIRPAADQDIFTGDWSQVKANGLFLQKVAPEARDLMLWEDGSVAIGLRPLGKGYIIQIGCKFTGKKINDRIEPRDGQARPTFEMRPDQSKNLTRLLDQILKWRKVPEVEGKLKEENDYVILRHYLSNNGLYDVWVLWNQSALAGAKEVVSLGKPITSAWDVIANKELSFHAGQLPVTLEPYQARAFLTPRMHIAEASQEWFALQRNWWRKPQEVSAVPLPKPENRYSVDLSTSWSFKPVAEGENGEAFAVADLDDSGWEKIDLGAWSLPDKKEIRHAVLRKSFTVPESWTNGSPTVSLQSWVGPTFADEGRIWLDGKLIKGMNDSGLVDANPDGVLTAGSKHVLAVEIKGKGNLNGSRGPAWLWFWPKPTSSLDLAGDWISSNDALTKGPTIKLPGKYEAMTLRREVVVPADKAKANVVLRIRTTGRLVGVILNGHMVRRFHHIIGERFDLNVTPWVKFGKPNEIELVSMDGPTSGNLSEVFLDFHDPKTYP